MADDVVSRPPKTGTGDGDWICEDEECANLNFARRTSCNRCGKEKSDPASASKKQIGIEIGKAAAEKSRGLFSADDWQCTKCGNVNWARRFQCNMCNAPKFGDVEERTGYGGGYNDRGVVEYISREESDDEFDEFGRRRKKFKGSQDEDQAKGPKITIRETDKTDNSPPLPEKVRPVLPTRAKEEDHKARDDDEEEEEAEEEEEEDDDDEDLSKYDLDDLGEGDRGGDCLVSTKTENVKGRGEKF